MIQNIVNLFTSLFSSCLVFTDFIYLLSAIALLSVIITVVIYLIRGKY